MRIEVVKRIVAVLEILATEFEEGRLVEDRHPGLDLFEEEVDEVCFYAVRDLDRATSHRLCALTLPNEESVGRRASSTDWYFGGIQLRYLPSVFSYHEIAVTHICDRLLPLPAWSPKPTSR